MNVIFIAHRSRCCRLFALFAVVSAGLSGANASAEVTLNIKAMTYNIKNGNSTTENTWIDRRPIVKRLIEQSDPDLFGTQEGFYFQIKDMAADMPQYAWVGLGRAGGSKDEFMAIFYKRDRFELMAYDHFWLSDTPAIIGSRTWGHGNRRMVTWARFRETESGVEFYHWNTHFDHEAKQARENSADLIMSRLRALGPKRPVIVTGDFNAAQNNVVHKKFLARGGGSFYLRDAWDLAPSKVNETVSTSHGWRNPNQRGRRIDWVLVSPEFQSVKGEIILYKEGDQWPSDHFPVVCDLILTVPNTDSRKKARDVATSLKNPWVPLFDGESLDDWTVRGKATWTVSDGVLIGRSSGGHGHIYAAPKLRDLEVKGVFRITSQGRGPNSGLYFRANPSERNPDGFPRGYEVQIANGQGAFTGWLWKPGSPTGKASALLTKDGEWFSLRVRAVGEQIQIWIKDQLVTTHQDDEYKSGYFAIQCHNPGMTIEAKGLYYRDLADQE